MPFGAAGFADNPEPECPCLLLLDTSSSMAGRPIEELIAGLIAFKDELMADAMATKRIEVAIVTFGPVRVISDLGNAGYLPSTQPSGSKLTLGTLFWRRR